MYPSMHFHASEKTDKSATYAPWLQGEKRDGRYQPQIDSESTAFYTVDGAGFITYYSKLAVEIWGRTPELGDTYERFVSPYIQYRFEGRYLPRGQSPMNDVLAGKIPGVFNAEVHIYRPDGSYIAAIVNIAPLVGDDGKIVGAVKSFCQNPLRKPAKDASATH
jgi:PAS domain-containing protein